MLLRNYSQGYGLISQLLHWVMAMLIIGLFVLGKYMVSLDYYDPWYQKAPDLHRSLGVITAILLMVRLGWRLANLRPSLLGKPWERCIAAWVHRFFYILVAAIVISGYLFTTANGQSVSVFDWFQVPAIMYGTDNHEELAGMLHEWFANALILLVILHTLGAMKHHLIDRDSTLLRMLNLRGASAGLSAVTHKLEE